MLSFPSAVLDDYSLLIRGQTVRGWLHRVDLTLRAEEGDALIVDATSFVPHPEAENPGLDCRPSLVWKDVWSEFDLPLIHLTGLSTSVLILTFRLGSRALWRDLALVPIVCRIRLNHNRGRKTSEASCQALNQ